MGPKKWKLLGVTSHRSCDRLGSYGWKLQITFFTNSTSRQVVSISVKPSRSVWLTMNLQQTSTWRKMSSSATHKNFLLTGTQALVIRQDRRLNDNDVYLDVRCVQSPTNLPCFTTSHNEFLAIRMLFLFQTFAMFWMLYALFWAITRCLNFIYRRFGTLCLFHLHRRIGVEWL